MPDTFTRDDLTKITSILDILKNSNVIQSIRGKKIYLVNSYTDYLIAEYIDNEWVASTWEIAINYYDNTGEPLYNTWNKEYKRFTI